MTVSNDNRSTSNPVLPHQLQERLRFETLLTNISARFVNLPADRIDAEIEDAQRLICECLTLDLSSLWQWSDSAPHSLILTHLHSPPQPYGPARPEHLDGQDAFPWHVEQLMKGKVVAHTINDLPPEAARDIESYRTFGIKSSVNIPLSTGGGPLIGILSFDDLRVERSWPDPILKRLRLLAQIFANALARKRWELMARESEARLNMAVDAAGVGLWALEIDTGYLWASNKTRELFRFTQIEDLNYKRLFEIIHPSDHQRVEHAIQTAVQSGEKVRCEYRVVLPDESVRWIVSIGNRISDPQRKSVRLMGASLDASERKEMEQRLRTQLEEINDLKQKLEHENRFLRKEIELQHDHKEIVGRSPAMQRILAQVEQVARTDATVLIEGETGTGKELLARATYRLSDRKGRPLITVNCASLPPTLIESELFGREKGAYTGALTRMIGRFEMADKATLFLDEIGELPLDVQAKLLRVLEQGRFERLGSSQSMQVDVRIIAATNQDLAQQVAAGRFRKDLYYRLNVFPIHLPPLRERPEDIPPLVWNFVRQFEGKMGRRIDLIRRQCMDDLQRYAWPGNIRELRNVIERALIVCSSKTLEVPLPGGAAAEVREEHDLETIERRHILDVLQKTDWRLSGQGSAAEILGLKRTTLYSKMKKLGIRRPEVDV
ncbi:MAG: sigma 54-interacting transcriptional regulator [Desulfosarcina sp.]